MVDQLQDLQWMEQAYTLAQRAENQGEVPVGAVLVLDNEVVGEGWNQPITTNDPTTHAEIVALRQAAAKLENYRLLNTTLYVTLEPCAMCLGAMIQARVKRLVFAAYDPRAGAVASVFQILNESRLNHHIQWEGGLMAEACGKLLKDFFRQRRC